ncbi:isopenicillin N-CoA synthetase [Metarhizium album ARSEF 1941]|uniref:Isopenicillin N-CoA synthetase n=1 Tax=Metarhizium album (strain ARSEF 1941) TaxID=1081103 RepID=A0A0B2WVU7_METAS|nr:isopenicillin N-CoA synthetase [Metarhizium album ARSEF 1941]KHO00242.1 isopenicillin N-CoA synthetase [Metarhizium album ARSEF 1941]
MTAYLDAKLHISKDWQCLRRTRQGMRNFDAAVRAKKASVYFLFEAAALRQPNDECIWSRQGVYTWAETYQRASQYGHYFQSLGVMAFQYVGLYMYNSPEFLFIWLGLLSIGAAPALINYNLASGALLHCVKVSGTKVLIYDSAPDCVSRIQASGADLRSTGVEPVVLSDGLKDKISQNPATRPVTACFEDTGRVLPFALMYTRPWLTEMSVGVLSGTTGMPKASPLAVQRLYMRASVYPRLHGQEPGPGGDKSYYCIPLYHGTGGIGAMEDMMTGTSVALAPKFSLSRFWQDCVDSKATVFVYGTSCMTNLRRREKLTWAVGELVRYLLAAPPSPNDKSHRIRLAWGNGLSPELWQTFQSRFGVAEIGEFFGSTEGVVFMTNQFRSGLGSGAVGHHGWLLRRQYHKVLVPVHVDPETGDVWRSPETGFARRLPYEQGRELLARLTSRDDWAGYFGSEEATRQKLLQDVFEKGDLYWRTGDALRRDGDGYWYFMDRLGDTYRWKGENVSTTEVTQVLGTHPQIAEANVYGVKIPSHDGRAGCAALALRDGDPRSFDWASVAALLRKELPAYAVPVFIRVRRGLGSMSTANHKHNKVSLRLEGVDPRALGTKVPDGKDDALFWLPAGSNEYVPFSQGDWDRLAQLRARI